MKRLILTLIAVFCFASTAMAVPISGSINFLGYASYVGGTTPSDATGIDFLGAFTGYGNTGDYGGVFSSNVQFNDFSFKPNLNPSPVTLWSFTFSNKTYDFNMSSVNYYVSPDGSSLTLVGTGMLGITGFDDTLGSWIFTTQGNNSTLTFSATAAPVPEPSTLLLIGSGLVGIFSLGRRRMKG